MYTVQHASSLLQHCLGVINNSPAQRGERQSLLPTFPRHCLQYWKEKAGSGANAVVPGLLSGYLGTTGIGPGEESQER